MNTKPDCRAWSLLLVASLALGGCVVAPVDDGYYQDEVVVVTPPARVEYRGYPPVAGYIWIDGFWSWSGYRHDWVPGYWAPPHHRHFRPPVRRADPAPRHFERDHDRGRDWDRTRDRDRDWNRDRDRDRAWDRDRDRDRSHGWTAGDDRRRDGVRDGDERRERALIRQREEWKAQPRLDRRERIRPERREQARPQPPREEPAPGATRPHARPGFGERMRENAGAVAPRAVQAGERRANPATLRERIDARRSATEGQPGVGRAAGEARPQGRDPRARPSWPRPGRDGGG